MSFVPRTQFPKYNVLKANLKGHQVAAMTRISQLAPQVDFVVEVRDARAPIATANPIVDTILAQKPKLIVYSKGDLSTLKPSLMKQVHQLRNEQHIFVNTRDPSHIKQLIKKLTTTFDSVYPQPPLGFKIMVVGFPNIGKSSMINTLRQVGLGIDRKVARTGNNPGVTAKISSVIKLNDNPEMYVYDTPGVMLPSVKDVKTMLSLSLVGCVDANFVDPYIQADYLLYLLNLQDPRIYRKYCGPTNSVDQLLGGIATTRRKLRPDGTFSVDDMARHWIYTWRNGTKGLKGILDHSAITSDPQQFSVLLESETDRFKSSDLYAGLSARLGNDGTGRSNNRQRTAKDRAADMKNRLFKL